MSLLPPINDCKTKKAARELLSEYRRLARIAGGSKNNKKVISAKVDQVIYPMWSITSEVENISQAVKNTSPISCRILWYKYIQRENWTNTQIRLAMQDKNNSYFSERDFERKLANALIEFAEAYEGGKLLEF